MAENTNIEWCDATFNGWIGCTRISPACDNCYAAVSTPARTMGIKWGFREPRRRTGDATWEQPAKWNRQHAAFFAEHGRRRRVFCSSLADVFDKEVPAEWRLDLLSIILSTPNLDWLVLTKRVGNVRTMLSEAQRLAWAREEFDVAGQLGRWLDGAPPANVWMGITVCNQEEADRDIPKLLYVPAVVRFLSMEPLLGLVVLPEVFIRGLALEGRELHWPDGAGVIRWVIVGGESGPHARPIHPDWARSLSDQCAAAAVPMLFKQWGEWLPAADSRSVTGHVLALQGAGPISKSPMWHVFEDGQRTARVGKAAAGRLLDGRTHDEFPEVTS